MRSSHSHNNGSSASSTEASNAVGGLSEPPVRHSSAARNRASARSETKTSSGSVSSKAVSVSKMSRIADMTSLDPLPMSRLRNRSSTVKSSSSIKRISVFGFTHRPRRINTSKQRKNYADWIYRAMACRFHPGQYRQPECQGARRSNAPCWTTAHRRPPIDRARLAQA